MAAMTASAQTPPVPGGPATAPSFSIRADRGFIDDTFAIAPATKSLAVLLTDAASFARIDVIDLETGKPRRTLSIGDPQRLFERLVFADDGVGLVLISRDASTGRRYAQSFGGEGKAGALVGPAATFDVVTSNGGRFLLATGESKAAGGTAYTVNRHRLTELTRAGKGKTVVITKAGDLKEPALKGVSWQDGHSVLVGLAPGGYDKARDIRVPDEAAVYDLFADKITWRSPVGDVMAWATAGELRRKYPGRALYTVMSADTKSFDVYDWLGRHAPLELPVPIRYYDPTTLNEREDAGTRSLLFSLTIDPLHPEALARQKKDPSFLDIYWVRVAGPQPGVAAGKDPLAPAISRLVRVAADERPTSWIVAGKWGAVLRKHKNFSRGGGVLEAFPLADTAPP